MPTKYGRVPNPRFSSNDVNSADKVASSSAREQHAWNRTIGQQAPSQHGPPCQLGSQ